MQQIHTHLATAALLTKPRDLTSTLEKLIERAVNNVSVLGVLMDRKDTNLAIVEWKLQNKAREPETESTVFTKSGNIITDWHGLTAPEPL